MAFCRRETSQTMLSKAGSNSELGRGLSHILEDLEKNLPNSLDELQDPVAYLKYVLPPKEKSCYSKFGKLLPFWISTISCPSLQDLDKQLADLEAQEQSAGVTWSFRGSLSNLTIILSM